ncbi:hypothetical protein PSHT_02466 [Puccinia striiformis]|uniref:HORMA domain-containing protein n=2 Tax=Puccinia striiformis TaxID=27350 RepID=A0A0L0VJ46_9BASI|nr:hypothetical protein H4Q26_013926 [Puccinia striiformis f. sp. tritici PST-130]KNE99317.1 hypothetical protein PSTG_07435 [Puccinia striiformis f. sp. tritici PST-78]POW21405.1 hypothetical protein PSHT_02466 [Puccinia striiformis]
MAYSLPFGGGIWDVGVIDQESDRPQTSKALDKVKPIKSKTATTTSKVSTDTQLMTSTQSLNVVKTLIQTGIGVITYLRGIFPEECFNDDKIGPDRSESSTGDDANSSEGHSKKSGREGRGYIRVKHINRGASKESDKVLDYLDEGAMDAIQRGYLRQLLFAMYLDPEKPRDVIECYTFNITYTKSKDREGELVPELEVRDQLREMSLGGKISILGQDDPQQSRKTCGVVKRQVQALIKNLICSTQSLSDIHGRRFLTFKLHYNDHTPSDYEPPHFTAGSAELDRFTFGTSGVEEVPSATEMGKIDTGYHGVRVALATISGFLPEPDASDSKLLLKGKSPLEIREIELNKIREAAKDRQVVWDTEQILAPSPPTTPNGFNKLDGQPMAEPIGRRDSNGRLVPLPRNEDISEGNEKVKILKRKATPEANVLLESDPMLNSTQTEIQSQATPISVRLGGGTESLTWSLKPTETKNSLLAGQPTTTQRNTDNQANKVRDDIPVISANIHSDLVQEKGPLESRPEIVSSVDTIDDPIEEGSIPAHNLTAAKPTGNFEPIPDSFDPIESFSPRNAANSKSKGLPLASTTGKSGVNGKQNLERNAEPELRRPDSNKKIKCSKSRWPPVSNKSNICECRDSNDDQDMIICEVCKRWRHLNCYGYTSEKDPRIPEFFVCYRCQIHKGMGLEDIWKREDDINIALEGLRGLAIFRRTLQIIYNEGLPPVLKDLALRLEVDLSTVSQIKHRLENENFIRAKPNKRSNTSGILESERKSSTQKSGTTKSKKWIKHMIVNQSYEQKKLRDKLYFTPGTGTEAKLLEKFGNVEDDVMKNLGEDETMSSGSISSLSPTTSPSPVVRGDMSRKREAPTKEAGDGQSPMNTTPKHILAQSSQPSITEDAVMHDASQLQHLEEVNDNSLMVAKNKVSIGAEKVEVLGVTWDDDE